MRAGKDGTKNPARARSELAPKQAALHRVSGKYFQTRSFPKIATLPREVSPLQRVYVSFIERASSAWNLGIQFQKGGPMGGAHPGEKDTSLRS